MSNEYVQEQIAKSVDQHFVRPEAEEAVIGFLLMKGTDIDACAAALTEEDFYCAEPRKIYGAILSLFRENRTVDNITVDAMLGERHPLEAGALSEALVRCSRRHMQTMGRGFKDYIDIVRALAMRRRAIAQFDALSLQLRDPTKDIRDTLSAISAAADGTSEDETPWITLGEVGIETYSYLEKRASGQIKAIPTGISAIDRMTGGLFGGELTVIAARPGVGKSAFGAHIAMEAAKNGFHVGIVSCEMSAISYGQRLLSKTAWVEGDKLRKADIDDEAWASLANALEVMDTTPVKFLFKNNALEEVVTSAKRMARHGEMDMLIIDYIGIMQTHERFREDRDRVKHISSQLKRLSMDANIPVIALCQVNRDAHGQMPTMAQLRDSGSVEQDADGILFLHRPEKADDTSVDTRDKEAFYTWKSNGMDYISICVAKQRNGSIGTTNVVFDPAYMRYVEIDRTEGR